MDGFLIFCPSEVVKCLREAQDKILKAVQMVEAVVEVIASCRCTFEPTKILHPTLISSSSTLSFGISQAYFSAHRITADTAVTASK